MYILTERLVEQIEFMEMNFAKEKEENKIKAQYGFFSQSAEDAIKHVTSAKIGGVLTLPYLYIQTQGEKKDIQVNTLRVIKVGKDLWCDDRSMHDVASAIHNKNLKIKPIDLTDYLNELYENMKLQEQKMGDTNPITGKPLPKGNFTFEMFLRTIAQV